MSAGGAERVMATLANEFQNIEMVEISLIILTGGEIFYPINDKVKIYKPNFNYKNFNRIIFTLKIMFFLRKTLQEIKPDFSLSFGGKYNSFCLLTSLGLGIKSFISDRSCPGISYGKFIDTLNSITYKTAYGIIAQTEKAKLFLIKKTEHKNIQVIGNPIKSFSNNIEKKLIILNVGRFIETKHQDWLIEYFNELETFNWELWFIGDGPLYEQTMLKAKKTKKSKKIIFFGNQKKLEKYYNVSAIFAFTSTSEGFPNALGEAMSAGCACISFDCEAGPSDLIENGINGWLVKNEDHIDYKNKLGILIAEEKLRNKFSNESIKKISNFDEGKISEAYLNFIK